jgi:4-carboxymuconolactone decarboxylase
MGALLTGTSSWAHQAQCARKEIMTTATNFTNVAPALEKYAHGPLSDLWKRPDLAPRDHSLVTVAALIARNQTIEMPHYLDLALDSGVSPGERSDMTVYRQFWRVRLDAIAADGRKPAGS